MSGEQFVDDLLAESRDDLVRVEAASQYLGVETSTVYVWAETGRLPHYRFGRSLRFSLRDLKKWREAQHVEVHE